MADVSPLEDPAVQLLTQVMAASHADSTYVLNQLYDAERRQRLALEVWIEDFQTALHKAHGGTYREMNVVLDFFAFPPMGYDQENAYARRHPNWTEPLSAKEKV